MLYTVAPTVVSLVVFSQKRKMETEAKGKVVASVWGAQFIIFLAAL